MLKKEIYVAISIENILTHPLKNWIELEVLGKNHIWMRQIKAKIMVSRLKLFLRNVSLPVFENKHQSYM